jgi:RNA polymerase sigma-70 factor (ECF subfamily)
MCALERQASDHNQLFVELLTLHQRTLYGFLYTLVPNPADAEDLLQQTSLILWQKFGEFKPGSNFLSWACQIAHFTVLDYLKKRRRSRVVFSEELISKLAETRHKQEDTKLADLTSLSDCIDKLSVIDRRLIELCYTTNHDIKEAAIELERPVSSVYVSLVRVRRLLMACLQRAKGEEVQA